MKAKIMLVLVLLVFLFSFKLTKAEVVLNEIQIAGDTVNDEFVELYNSGDAPVNLTGWYIQKVVNASGNATNLVAASRFQDKVILANSYLLLAKENGYTGDVSPDIFWPNSYGLASSNSLILYRGSETDKSEATWEEIQENQSIQKQPDGTWQICASTPGAENSNCEDTGNNTNNNSNSSSGSSSSTSEDSDEIEEKKIINPTIKAKILINPLAFVGEPIEIKSNILGYSNEVLSRGKLYWNFGDGSSLEQMNSLNNKLEHIYSYPGEYLLSLEYYSSVLSEEPEASQEIIIKVVPNTVIISKVGEAKDFFIELSNQASSNIDISGWTLRAWNSFFKIPEHTILMSKKQIKIPSQVSGFTTADRYDLKLYSSTGELVFDYNKKNTKSKINSNTEIIKNTNINTSTEEELSNGTENFQTNLTANVLENNLINNPKNKYLFYFGFILLLILAGSATYFIRRRKVVQTGEDFEILDE